MTMERFVYLIRHGATDWNHGGYIQGHLDTPLNEDGRTQARHVAQRLADIGATVLYSSDLLRTYETAHIIGQATGLPIIQKTGLREMHFGDWQGLSSAQIKERDPERYAARRANPHDVPPPGGETWLQFYQRGVNALHDILRTTDAEKIIIATHSGICTVLGLEALGVGYAGKRTFGNTNCAIHTIGIAADRWHAVSLNDTAHLPSFQR